MPKHSAILPLVTLPQKILRRHASEIPAGDIRTTEMQHLISAMKATLAGTPDGVGLAAPQVGHSLRLFIVSEEAEEIDRAEKSGWKRRKKESPEEKEDEPYQKRPWKYYVFINPVVKNKARRMTAEAEGCLSVPGKFGPVKRYEKITVEALDEYSKKFTRGSAGFFARVVQHELDHLDGTLFIDKAEELIDMSPATQKK
ncbi:MAG: peptide deformylase [Patescibacteria group bacterium]